MKFILKDEKTTDDIEILLKKGFDCVNLIAKDSRGIERYIMRFKDGRFERLENIELQGLETDENGRIKEME